MMTLADRPRPYRRGYRLARASLLGLMALLATHPTPAQVAHDFRLLPDPQRSASSQRAYFVFEGTAGQTIEDVVVVRNQSEESIQLSLFSADAVTASRGGVAVATGSNDTPKGAGAWLDISQTRLTLAPGDVHSVPFTVSLPGDLTPGEYVASIVAERIREGESGEIGSSGVRFIPRFAVTVLVRLPGSGADALRSHLEITDLKASTSSGHQMVVADLTNSGNAGLAKAEGNLTVSRTDGVRLQEMPVRLGFFLAHDSLDYRIGLEQELAAGEYDVTLLLTYVRGTVKLTRRLYLSKPQELPVVRAETLSELSENQPPLPRWMVLTIAAAGISIALLILLLIVQSRRLARARSKVS